MAQVYFGVIAGLVRNEALPRDKFGHQPRLDALTRQIAGSLVEISGGRQMIDMDVMFGAVWLHDLGVFVANRPADPDALARWDHVAYACARAPQILRDAGFPEAKIPAVLDAIRQHQPHDEPASLEATILRDADILEQLGAVAILRTVSKVGRDTRFSTFSDAVAVLRRNLDQLPSQIRLEPARRLAQPRIAALRAFLEAVDAEAGPNLF
jgi:uncharacterized protein